MDKELTPEIMQLIVDELVLHNDYNQDDVKIIDNTIETVKGNETEYLVVSFEEIEDWDFKLQYDLQEPYVYMKKHIVNG